MTLRWSTLETTSLRCDQVVGIGVMKAKAGARGRLYIKRRKNSILSFANCKVGLDLELTLRRPS